MSAAVAVLRGDAPPVLCREGERLHALAAVILAVALAVAAVLQPVPPGADLTLGGVRVPPLCLLRATTGVPCPACGLTRSWVSLAHGGWRHSLGHHPLGWLVLSYAVVQLLRHLTWLGWRRRRATVELLGRRLDRGALLVSALLVVAWLPRVAAAVLR